VSKAGTVRVLLILDTQHVYDRGVFEGIEQTLRSRGLSWQIETLPVSRCDSLLNIKSQWDAVIANIDHAIVRTLVAHLNIPTIAFSGQPITLNTIRQIVYVSPDHTTICESAIDHALKTGIQNLAVFSGFGNTHENWITVRANTFKTLADQRDYSCNVINQHKDLLTARKDPLFVFCVSDNFARELLTVSESLGIKVPMELSVIGVDHDCLDINLSTKQITTVPFHPQKIGIESVVQLIELLQRNRDEPFKKETYVLPEPIELGSTTIAPTNDETVNTAMAFIRNNFHTGIKAEQVSNHLGMSRSHLNKRFKECMDCSVHDMLMKERLDYVIKQLLETDQTISEIANQVGFSSKTYLFKCFKKFHGVSPQEYRDLKTQGTMET
jgi:LacI family transcriptional regulator